MCSLKYACVVTPHTYYVPVLPKLRTYVYKWNVVDKYAHTYLALFPVLIRCRTSSTHVTSVSVRPTTYVRTYEHMYACNTE